MTPKDSRAALEALFAWLDDQEIGFDDGVQILFAALSYAVTQISKEEKLDPRRGGVVIAEMIIESIRRDQEQK